MSSAASVQEIEDLTEKVLDDTCDQIAVHAIAKHMAPVVHQRAMAAAILRRTVWLYARLTSFTEADEFLVTLGRPIRARASREPKRGRAML